MGQAALHKKRLSRDHSEKSSINLTTMFDTQNHKNRDSTISHFKKNAIIANPKAIDIIKFSSKGFRE